MNTPVIVLASGRGERLRPFTDHTPKPLVKVSGETLLDRTLTALSRTGFTEVFITVHHLGDKIRDHLAGRYDELNVFFVEESALTGPAGAALSCRPHLPAHKQYLVLSGDAFTDLDYAELVERHRDSDAYLTVVTQPSDEPHRFGVLEVNGLCVTAMREKPTDAPLGSLISCGMYVLSRAAVEDLTLAQRETLDFVDVINAGLQGGQRIMSFRHDGVWEDVGTAEVSERLGGAKVTGE